MRPGKLFEKEQDIHGTNRVLISELVEPIGDVDLEEVHIGVLLCKRFENRTDLFARSTPSGGKVENLRADVGSVSHSN